ncbi:DUF2207 domain-containing protein [Ponticaulis sp.]|uniref:DUF2207 domain-containing protein n=1 Tax=Ponticaulis sp. TaxID=2020902 RepID=UPI000B6B6390|nr:DUF2207 domain-containing protein [Ponticaulis sp.]MAI91126.1 hypothetical protein [Ponticaulis sp.]OUX98445.1 MAG: hypothetical protein CBB65_11815 [Hyphomonadaceae bacterium TMED5]|tara:strand:+ start:10918 stop:12630 length:1713 start_codon:yes stop_codon:yes gene_type:complete
MMLRALLLCLAALSLTAPALAQSSERITEFNVSIDVETDGDILVTERITVIPFRISINRGIYRALPDLFSDADGNRYRYHYDVQSVTRNGAREPYETYTEGNGYFIRIGDEDVLLPIGTPQTYEITYEVKNQIRYFDSHDELYWNVTGNYWDFPIDAAKAEITLPEGAEITDVSAYTGALGQGGLNTDTRISGNRATATLTSSLRRNEGLTISVSMAKGLIDPPSFADKFDLLWQRFLGLGLLVLSFCGVGFFYFRSWQAVGRDAPRLPVFPIYHPPKGVSAGAAHCIYHRTFKDNTAFASNLMQLASKGYLTMESDKDTVTLTRAQPETAPPLEDYEQVLLDQLFKNDETRTIGKAYDSSFASAYNVFISNVKNRFGPPYFRWNTAYILIAGVASVLAIIIAIATSLNWTSSHTLIIGGLIILNLIFMYLMPAQTKKGERARSEILGLRLYMETAEKHQMNAVDPHGDTLPAMSKDRYEELLPYAMALDVEKPWSKYFEDVLPDEARAYRPVWYSGYGIGHSLHGMNSAMSSAISSGVSTASVQPSSSSGGGGGGFSGGGGGGGGGGGW